jgi:hypothetical protein
VFVFVRVLLCLLVAGCGSLLPWPNDPEAYAHTSAILCLRLEVVGTGQRQGWPVEERQIDWQQALEAYDKWNALEPPVGADGEVATSIAAFETSWVGFNEETAFDVAFRCRQMVARIRSFFDVTTQPSMPVD